ncbi:MAG: biotin/lipoyl-binding protein, partial [Gemmatimonadetes bacterium]|nr:biotin/lipoyl-binding protein [Gemmatimonadota bacterium]NIQ55518.1 biotin/lipoyl-binding protein [Gemmatimonadota bacterium]NIU75728.1 biotin/lipoyl-binding protein [Gammaproteobacteria bacterium]NIX45385.1 biotin/lipoyl-binding protein [Gemmatimonadota bacterium]NIY09670.1 biotin/lipoyl-binding protein [Gemmatimonadota bacterium]
MAATDDGRGGAMKRRIAIAGVAVAAIAVAAWLALGDGSGPGVLEASGTVEATEADLGFNLPGRIASVEVDEGDAVREGDVLARLDAAELEARRAAAQAQAEAARAVLAELEAGSRS